METGGIGELDKDKFMDHTKKIVYSYFFNNWKLLKD